MNGDIKKLSADEVETLISWARDEGWNPGAGDAAAFRTADPEGFLGCFVDDQMVAGISAIRYGESFGFIGLYICHTDYRGQGFGLQVWEAGMDRLAGRTIGLDGVPEQQDNYGKMGFVKSYSTARWSGAASSIPTIAEPAVPVSPTMLDGILAIDWRYFPEDRETFVRSWIAEPRKAFAVFEDGMVKGYAVLRACGEGHKVGPIFALDFKVAVRLLAACAEAAGDGDLHLDIPDAQSAFTDFLDDAGFQRGFETARMYLGDEPEIDMDGVFAITTLELG